MNHGWITPNKNGTVARCGGPFICSGCQKEFKNATEQQRVDYINRCIRQGIPHINLEFIEKQERKKEEDNRDIQAAFEGKRAWFNHIPVTGNPYRKDSSSYFAWEHAWLKAQESYMLSSPEGL